MKRKKVLQRLRLAAAERLICNMYHKGEAYYTNCWPLLVSEELVVCAHDADFLINGYGAYPIDGIARMVIKEDKCAEFSRMEGLLEQVVVPEIACDSWQALFSSLSSNQLIGVERRNAPADESTFVIGRIVKAGRKRLHIIHVDPDAVWQEQPWRIRYTDIIGVTFGDRYLTVFGKYAGEPQSLENSVAAEGNE